MTSVHDESVRAGATGAETAPPDEGGTAATARLRRGGAAAVGGARLIGRTIRDAGRDRILGRAAEVAFFALLSIPSFLLVLAGAAGYVSDLLGSDVRRSLQERITAGLGSFLSPETMSDFVGPAVEGLFTRGRAGLLSIGAVLALWSVSRMVRICIEAVNLAYDVEVWRPAWRRRLLALGLSIAGFAVLAVVLPVIVAGPKLGAAIVDRYGLPGAVDTIWRVAYWPVAAAVAVSLLAGFYHVAPNRRTPWRRDLPGAILAAAAWVAAAFGLRIYVDAAVSEATAGPLAAPIILMLWLYASALAVLLGAELNAQIDRSRAASGTLSREDAAEAARGDPAATEAEPLLPATSERQGGRWSGVVDAALIGGVAVAVIAVSDVVVGSAVSLSILFLIPVGLGSWRWGVRGGLPLAALGAGGALLASALTPGGPAGLAPYANAGIRLVVFALAAYLVAHVREQLDTTEELARIDPLTRIPNRRHFMESLAAELARSRRHGRPLSLAFIDLDGFKAINDRFGHPAGDTVLRGVAERLRREVRRSDTVARLGGDEFAVLLPETARDRAAGVVRKLIDAVGKVPSPGRALGASAGLVTFENPPEDPMEALAMADRLMYKAKVDTDVDLRSTVA